MLGYIKMFSDWEELLEPFDDAQRGQLLNAMMRYAFHGEDTVFPPENPARYVWPVFRRLMDQAESKSAAQAANARGGKNTTGDDRPSTRKPRKAKESQTEPTKANASQQKPTQAKLSQTEPTQANESEKKPTKAKMSPKEQEQDKEQEHEHDHEHDHEQENEKDQEQPQEHTHAHEPDPEQTEERRDRTAAAAAEGDQSSMDFSLCLQKALSYGFADEPVLRMRLTDLVTRYPRDWICAALEQCALNRHLTVAYLLSVLAGYQAAGHIDSKHWHPDPESGGPDDEFVQTWRERIQEYESGYRVDQPDGYGIGQYA